MNGVPSVLPDTLVDRVWAGPAKRLDMDGERRVDGDALEGLEDGLVAFIAGTGAQIGWLWWRSRPILRRDRQADTEPTD